MPPSYFLGLAIMIAGILVRLWALPKFLDLYTKRYAAAPRRSWLWTSVPEPEIERWRRFGVLGSTITLAGAIVLVAGLGR